MKPITMDKDALRARIEENRSKHEAIFEEAVEGYKNEAVRLLERHIERIRKGKLERVYVQLPMPENHIGDYDRVIDMLDCHIEDTIELDERDFASYVRDDWDWKQQFITSNSAYSATAARISSSS